MDGRLALSRGQQNGQAADQTLPVTERLLNRLPRPRAAWVLVWAAIPVVAGLLPSAYLATVGAKPLPVRLLIGLVFVTVTVWRTAVLADPWTALRWLPVSLLVNLPLLTAV